ncbi:DEAD/DEAH box helicase [Actinomadura sp. DC4]|uniref:DEAD/DEAH box helicase n=1 Tax=Actinomadura sp. DC4 TaxID=3055069 RepID=UPI0025AF48EB|nr:DEAD/DEAH box helicase [Actinomadura sp. DC4]MDN3353751.1 DEAD/DEAH box helicase [Actinomadura sp. DC4]
MAHTADLTSDTEAEGNSLDAEPLRAGKAARAIVADGRAVHDAIEAVLAAPEESREVARRAYEVVRDQLVAGELDTVPVDQLRELVRGRPVTFTPVRDAGLDTVGAVLTAGAEALRRIPGVRRRTAKRIMAAAWQMRESVEESVRVRIEPDARTPEQAALIAALRRYERTRSPLMKGPDPSLLATEIGHHLGPAARGASRRRMLFTFSEEKKQEARDALAQLDATLSSKKVTAARKRLSRAESQLDKARKIPRAARLWSDYLARPVAYNALLIEVAGLDPTKEAGQGFLPADIAEQVRVFPLDRSRLKTSLRAYQAFGARFALVQERVILGDEMGLGKTIQSLAAMCHLAAKGETHFLVVCPASVVVNWTREVERHTLLEAHRMHGPGEKREAAQQEWVARGGVTITTFEALRTMPEDLDVSVAMMVVDEAHYVKNPNALRTQAVGEWAARSRRVLFLTGTPMENKVREFLVLVGHLRPEVAENLDIADEALDGTKFREAVAPVYLRRNQEDVLSELPPRLETQEWVTLEGPTLRAYREAVIAGNFMAMRRAAFDPGTVKGSPKLRRLVEIVSEAADGGRKVVVFSYFRDVLETVTQVLGSERDGVQGVHVVGPLTGDIPPMGRQAMVDEFTAAKGPAVLVSQIQAGGVGLNIQAASVIIIAEPQLTPSIEEQAIARAHRMGQVRRVDVHRLLCGDSVDQRVLELLADKREAFDEYARRSDMANAAPDAVDTGSETELRHTIVAAEQKRLKAA